MKRSVFGLIREIDPADDRSWRNRIFLTFDIDWANDGVIADTLDIVERYEVPATWFITHRTDLLNRIRRNKLFDVGLHPNFNPLLGGDTSETKNAASVLLTLRELAPEATTVRSHSLVHSERLADLFATCGLRHVCNSFIPINQNNKIAPWQLWDGLTMVPHCWQDNVAMRLQIPFPGRGEAADHLVVCDFHPIHLCLNPAVLDRYESSRQLHQTPDRLIRYRFGGKGTRTRLLELLESNGSEPGYLKGS